MDSQEYWKRRETQQRNHNIRDEKEYQKHIQKIYQNMMDEIEKEINGFYGKYAKKNGMTMSEAKKKCSELDMETYKRKAARYVKKKDFSKQANEEMQIYNLTMKANRLELLKAKIGLEMISGFDELEKYYDEILTDRTLKELERQAGVLGETVIDNQKMAPSIVNASFHNATYSDRIWMYQDLLKSELSGLLQTGLIRGQDPTKLAAHLRKRFGVSQSNAERLMITELARVQTEAQKQSFERSGFGEYTFLALGTACPVCRALDEKHFKVKEMMPGTNAPPMHPRCRCSVAAYEDSEDYEAWLDFLDKGGTTDEWNKLKSKQKSSGNTIKAKDVTREYLDNAKPGKGTIRYDSTYDKARHAEEIEVAQWIRNNLGGDVLLLDEINEDKKKTPDYLWNNKYWDLKSVTTEKAANSAIRKALKQIAENPGGVILDYQDRRISYEILEENIDRRMRQSTFSGSIDIFVLSDGRKIKVYRYNN